MRTNRVKDLLRQGRPTFWSGLRIDSTFAAEIMAHVGFDALTIDCEHSPIDFPLLLPMLQAISTTPTVPLVRVPANEPTVIKRVLDAGAYGVVVPGVSSVAEAQQAVQAVRYPPAGRRGQGPYRAIYYGGEDYRQRANDEILLVVMIEHVDGVRDAHAILSVPGVDACTIGPSDLGASMVSRPGERPSPDALEGQIQLILQAGRDCGVPVGTGASSAGEIEERLRQGFAFISLGFDTSFLEGAAQRALALARPWRQG